MASSVTQCPRFTYTWPKHAVSTTCTSYYFEILDTSLSLFVSTCNRFQLLTNLLYHFQALPTFIIDTFKLWQLLHSIHSNAGNFQLWHIHSLKHSIPDDFVSGISFNTATFSPGRAPNFLLRTNLKYANRKILISLFLYYASIFTHSHIYTMHKWHKLCSVMLFN